MENIFSMKISKELREKIQLEMIIDPNIAWKTGDDHVGILNFSDDDELYLECMEWHKLSKCHIKSLNFMRVDKIGRFNFLRPEGYSGYDFHFRVRSYVEKTWKDWFIPVEEEYKIIGME